MRKFSPSNLISQPKILLYCFVAGSLIWFFNELNNRSNATMNYPINFNYELSEELIEVTPPPKTVEISINGTGWNLLRNLLKLNIVDVEYNINRPLQTKFILSSSLVTSISETLENVNLNYVVTDSIIMNIEKRSIKEIEVLVDSSKFFFTSGHERVSDFILSNEKLTVEGPQSILNSLPDQYYINSKAVSDLNSDFNENISVDIVGDLISVSPEIINLNFKVVEYIEEEVRLNVNFNENDYSLDTSVVVTYKFRRDEELTKSDSLFITLRREDNILVPTVNDTDLIQILDIYPNSFILD